MFEDLANFFKEQWEAGTLWAYEQFLSAGLFLIDLIGVPSALLSMGSIFSGIPEGVWFLLEPFQLEYGGPLIISAYGIRFFIRRLPVIG